MSWELQMQLKRRHFVVPGGFQSLALTCLLTTRQQKPWESVCYMQLDFMQLPFYFPKDQRVLEVSREGRGFVCIKHESEQEKKADVADGGQARLELISQRAATVLSAQGMDGIIVSASNDLSDVGYKRILKQDRKMETYFRQLPNKKGCKLGERYVEMLTGFTSPK